MLASLTWPTLGTNASGSLPKFGAPLPAGGASGAGALRPAVAWSSDVLALSVAALAALRAASNDGGANAAVSSVMSSTVIATAVDEVAPIWKRVVWAVKASPALA